MLIGSRNGFAVKSKQKWQNPYVTDGLIAMWDGEWNAGTGINNPNATDWKAVIGENVYGQGTGILYDQQNHYYDLNKIGQSDAARFILNQTFDAQVGTFEVVINGTYSNGNYKNIMLTDKYTPIFKCSTSQLHFYGFNSSSTFTNLALNQTHYVATTSHNSYQRDCYINGAFLKSLGGSSVLVDWISLPAVTANSVSCKIYALRLYSRALTADEIAANYDVDKIRFNLP